ncbi:uncharacterized protein LOC128215865 [Mya arenaria]|uniref:uncharacterized protein LOC128215865 n=1 Tax=Mya arenaria TaxID=6604 RepID=UPI0022E06250|nr:uncharacterized protein LOC128215865 [Mya arenaria]
MCVDQIETCKNIESIHSELTYDVWQNENRSSTNCIENNVALYGHVNSLGTDIKSDKIITDTDNNVSTIISQKCCQLNCTSVLGGSHNSQCINTNMETNGNTYTPAASSQGDTVFMFDKKGVRCAHLNVCHLLPKLEEIKYHLCQSYSPNILGLCETFLHADINDNMLQVKNYTFERKDREHKKGGGILVYVNNNIQYRRRLDLEVNDIESIWLEINGLYCKSLLINFIYRPPNSQQKWIDLYDKQLGMFMVYFLLHLSPWILVFITIERVVVVVFPLHIKHIFTLKRAILVFAVTVFFFTILDAHLLFHFHLIPANFVVQNVTNKSGLDLPQRAVCVYNERHTFFMFKIWNWIDFVFAFGIPFLTLFIGNSLIIRTLISQETFRHTSSLRPEVNRRTSDSKRWTKVSVILSLAFIMLALPIVVYQIGQPFWVPEQPDQATRNTLELIQVILHILLYTNSAINVVLFLLLGNARFRKEFMKPLRDCVCTVCKCIRTNTRGNLQGTEMTATRNTFLGSES